MADVSVPFGPAGPHSVSPADAPKGDRPGMRSNPRELLVVAGEASGDLHGARLISELRRRVPDLATFGLGGDEMRAAGLQPVAHSSEVSVVGITEVLKVLPRIREVFADLLHEVDRRRPALAVLIDFPDFNLRLARQLKERGLEVIYYISPQVWAWRRGRVKTIARLVDRMLVLFPFEVDFYRGQGVDVIHVGHPLVDEVPVLPQAWERAGETPGKEGPFRVALLPGSRVSEVEALLPTLLAAAGRLAAELPIEVRIIRAPTVPRELLDEAVDVDGRRQVADRFVFDGGQVGDGDLRPLRDVVELHALGFAHLAQERAGELGVGVDLARQLGLHHQELGRGGGVAACGRDGRRRLVGVGGEVVGTAPHRVEQGIHRLLDA